ncbi:MAG: hypothetical protein RBU28_11400 [Bacteroidales bacterium]|nr:hypothetical protein [Bacteroidales bacterium]
MRRFLYIIALLLAPVSFAAGQNSERLIQVTGLITDDQAVPVENCAVISVKLRKAGISSKSGIYSVTGRPGDTIIFRALGFRQGMSVIPSSFDGRFITADIRLEPDTIMIDEVVILPWKNYHEFITEMTEERPQDPLIVNMNENLASIYASASNEAGYTITPEAGFKYAMEQNFSALSTRNQYPFNNLLNPLAWAKFFSEVKNGLLKNQDYSKPVKSKTRKKKPKGS